MKLIRGLEHICCEDSLKERGLFGSGEASLQPSSLAALKGADNQEENQLFTWVVSDRTRESGFKLKEVKFRLDIRGKFTLRAW